MSRRLHKRLDRVTGHEALTFAVVMEGVDGTFTVDGTDYATEAEARAAVGEADRVIWVRIVNAPHPLELRTETDADGVVRQYRPDGSLHSKLAPPHPGHS